MDSRTVEHLRIGRRNRDIARVLLSPVQAGMGIAFAPWDWVAIIAFYAAVHHVNAYLWESARIDPVNHAARSTHVRRDRSLRRCRSAYGRLRDFAFHARYTPGYAVSEQEARDLVSMDLRAVENAVSAALKLPPPIW